MSFSVRFFGMAMWALASAALGVVAVRAQEPAAAEGAAADPTAVTMRDPDAEAANQEGQTQLEAGEYKKALEAFNRALALDSTYPDPMVGIGQALLKLEDYQGAAVAFTRALDALPSDPVAAYNGLGEANMELGQIDMAQNAFRNALERDRNNAAALSNLGHVLVNNTRDPATALRYLDDALALNDQDARAYRDRGLAHAQMQEFEDSEADLRKAAEVDPDDFENYSTLAQVFQFQDKYAEAVDAMTKAIETYKPKKRGDPEKFITGYLMRADARHQMADKSDDAAARREQYQGVVRDSNAVLAEYEDRYPESGIAFYRRGRAQRMLERYSDAVDSFTRAIQVIPPGVDASWVSDAYMYRGICWFFIGSLDLARGDFEQASSVGAGFSDARVYLWLGITYHKEDDYRRAIDYYSQAINKSPNFALAHVNKGRAYVDLKEYGRALESFGNAIRAEPNVGENYFNMGLAYNKLEQYQKAVDFLNLAIRKENPQPKMYREMAVALRGLGRDELAGEYERKAGGAAPQRPAAGG